MTEWWFEPSSATRPVGFWLLGYFANHAAPHSVKISTLRKLCGGKAEDVILFSEGLWLALEELKICGAIASWKLEHESDLVTVDCGLTVTESQQRHPIKKQKQLPKSNK